MRENLEVALDALSDKNARRPSNNRGAIMNPLPVHIYREHDYSDFTSTKNLSLRAETLRLKATPAILALVNTHLEAEHNDAFQSPDLSDDLADAEAAAVAADAATLEDRNTRHQEFGIWAVPESEVYAMRNRVRMGRDGLIRRRRDRAITDDKDAIKRARYDGIALDV